MKYIEFDDPDQWTCIKLLGRVAIDFNPAYNDQVKGGEIQTPEEGKFLDNMFEKFVTRRILVRH